METSLRDRIFTKIYYFSIMLFIIGFSFSDNPVGNWYQQFMPNLNGRSVTDLFFLDSLTGWSVTNATNQNPDTTYVLKTTDGGDNWIIEYRRLQTGGGFPGLYRVFFLNQSTGYICGVTGIDKSTDGGTSWVSLNAPLNAYLDMSVLSVDTMWIASSNPFTGGVFRTTNGGVSWQNQGSYGSYNPDHIYMFNARIGFHTRNLGSNSHIYKTTDSGSNWSLIVSNDYFFDMYFADSLVGWKCTGFVKKTTDGGLNWVTQTLPFGGMIQTNGIGSFSNVSRDTIWANGGYVLYPNNQVRGILNRTTNGGDNWLFQIPDTAIHIGGYGIINFTDRLHGWALGTIHTTTGGDTTFITSIEKINEKVPGEFILYQNYPNPFNSSSKFEIRSSKLAYAQVKVFDINGRLLKMLLDQKLAPGEYEITFDAKELPSGVYFYSLFVNGTLIDTKKMMLVK